MYLLSSVVNLLRPRFVFRLSHLPFCQMGTKKGQHKNGCPDGRRDTRLLPVGTPTFRQLQPSRTCVLHTLYHYVWKMSMPEGQKPLFLHISQKSVGYPTSFCFAPHHRPLFASPRIRTAFISALRYYPTYTHRTNRPTKRHKPPQKAKTRGECATPC